VEYRRLDADGPIEHFGAEMGGAACGIAARVHAFARTFGERHQFLD